MLIRQVTDTALWVAMYRACESDRPDAHFHDPHARRMAGHWGLEIVRGLPHAQSMAWSIIVRTVVMDELILRCVRLGAGTVVNLGAGLDTRALRLPLPATLNWFDGDLPEMVAYRHDCLHGETPVCKHTNLAADLSDAAARKAVLVAARKCRSPLLVLTEGLLVYLAPEQVSALAQQLRGEPQARWWITDLVTPWLLESVGLSWQPYLMAARAPFRFAQADSARFFEPLGWHETEFRSIWEEAQRLQRLPPLASWWNVFGQPFTPGAHAVLRRMAGVSLLERIELPA